MTYHNRADEIPNVVQSLLDYKIKKEKLKMEKDGRWLYLNTGLKVQWHWPECLPFRPVAGDWPQRRWPQRHWPERHTSREKNDEIHKTILEIRNSEQRVRADNSVTLGSTVDYCKFYLINKMITKYSKSPKNY
jgi:hypothetical protein